MVAGFMVAGFMVAGFMVAGFMVAGFMVAGFMVADSMAVSPASDFTPASPASMAADFTPASPASMAAGFIPGCTNFMPAASTTAILANSTGSANSNDLITTASAVDLLSSPPLAAGGVVDGPGPITITRSGGAADGAGPTTITQTVATTGPDPTPTIGITASIGRATTPT